MTRFIFYVLAAVMMVACMSRGAAAERFICESHRGASPYPAAVTPNYDHDRYAPNEKEVIKRFGAYVSSFDRADDDNGDGAGDLLAVPEWVAYELKGVSPNAAGHYEEPDISIKRPADWYKAPGLSFLWTDRADVTKKRIDNSYDGIGRVWNRGHLAMADHAQRMSWQASCNTHFFWNALPQAADMNQGPWRHLEDYTAAAANKFGRLWIIAGPVFEKDKAIGFIGEAKKGEVPVAVPHALFKVVVRETEGGNVDALAFFFPQAYEEDSAGQPSPLETWVNCSGAKKAGHVYDHRPRLTSVAKVEELTGLTFFPGVRNRRALRDTIPTALWAIEQQYWSPGGCARQNYVP